MAAASFKPGSPNGGKKIPWANAEEYAMIVASDARKGVNRATRGIIARDGCCLMARME